MAPAGLAASLLERIRSRRARAGVVGLGYVGLPLAVEFGRSGFRTTGARLKYSDPHVPALSAAAWPGRFDLASVPFTPATVAGSDCVVVLTDHRAFDYQMLIESADLIVDTRNAIRTRHPHVFRLGAPASDDTNAADIQPAA